MIDPSPRPIAAIRLDGGRLCVDFVNTLHDRFALHVEDYLATPERFAEWARRSGALAGDEEMEVPRSDPARARLMRDVRTLRDAAFRVLSARIDGLRIPAGALRIANSWLLAARKGEEITSDGRLELRAKPDDPALPLKRIALDLVETLAGARAGAFRLERCANQHSCGWLFADTSKNRRRRWCSMQTCGVASKMATLRQTSSHRRT